MCSGLQRGVTKIIWIGDRGRKLRPQIDLVAPFYLSIDLPRHRTPLSCSLGRLIPKTSCSDGYPVQFPPSTRSHFCFGSCAKALTIIARFNFQPTLESAAKGIGALEAHR